MVANFARCFPAALLAVVLPGRNAMRDFRGSKPHAGQLQRSQFDFLAVQFHRFYLWSSVSSSLANTLNLYDKLPLCCECVLYSAL